MAEKLLKWGLHPGASDALRKIGITPDRIVQTIGTAAASAGTHAKDGEVNGEPYSAAVDIRARDLSEYDKKKLLGDLTSHGFAAWARITGQDGWYGVVHIHAIWSDCYMKKSLRDQIHDWLHDKNGLVSHTEYQFFQPSKYAKDLVRNNFLKNNPMNG